MRTIRFSMALLLAACLSSPATGASAVRQLTLEECLKIALEHNLELEIVRFEPVRAGLNLDLAYAGYEPAFSASARHGSSISPGRFDSSGLIYLNTETESDTFSAGVNGLAPSGLTYSLAGNVVDSEFTTAGGPGENAQGGVSIRLQQPLLKNAWIDQTRYGIRVAKNRVKYSDQVLRYQVMSILASVESAYFNLIQARENVKVQEEALRLAQKLFEENKKRVEVGALAPLDEKQAEAETAMRYADLLSARYSLTSSQNVLKGLLSSNFPDWQDVIPEPSERLTAPIQLFDLSGSWQRALSQRPDLLQARLEVERTGVLRQLQFNQLFPQLDIVGTYGHSGTDDEVPSYMDQIGRGLFPNNSIGAELRIPLGNRAARSNHRLAKLEEEQSRLRLRKLEQDIMLAVDDAVAGAQTAYEAVKATERARVVAKEALDAEEKKRANGKSTSFFVLQLQKAYTDAQAAEIRALASYNRALSQLAFNEGSTLDRHGLALDIH